MKSLQDYYILKNGVKIPCMGFGTWRLENNQKSIDIIKTAIDCGYRHIDTAFSYQNEKAVGKAVRDSGLKREQLFVTSKLNNPSHGYENTLKEFNQTMTNLDIDYLDLYLIHWPRPLQFRNNWKEVNEGSWKAFEELYEAGKVRAIGVSNFLQHHIEPIVEKSSIGPMVNQLELHPQYVQRDTVKYCKDNDMVIEAWSPLIKGQFDNPILLEIANKYNKSVAQVLLRWSLQHNFLPLPKSSSADRMKENADVFNFELSSEDIEAMKELEKLGRTGAHPDTAPF